VIHSLAPFSGRLQKNSQISPHLILADELVKP
jgi:hypothetical protein